MFKDQITQKIESDSDRIASECAFLRKAKQGTLTQEEIDLYLYNLAYAFGHTPTHLRLAIQTAEARGEKDLKAFLDEKIREETGHDGWAKNDLKSRGARLETLTVTPATQEGMKRIGQLASQEPNLYLAYIVFTEYFTVLKGPEFLQHLKKHLGIPETQMTAIAYHAVLDQKHVADDLEYIPRFVKTAEMQAAFITELDRSARQIEDSLRSFVA